MKLANGPIASSNGAAGRGSRATQTVTASVGAITTGVTLAAPDKRCWLTIPASYHRTQPPLHQLGIRLRILAIQRSPLDNPLHRFRHVQPRAGQRGIEQADAALPAPVNHVGTVVASQIVPDEQHPQGRQQLIVQKRCRAIVPIRPAAAYCRCAGCWWAGPKDRRQLLLEPRVQDRVTTRLHRLGAQFTGRGPKEREQLHGAPTNVLVRPPCRLAFRLPGRPGLRNHLVRPSFILGPDRKPECFPYLVCLLNEPLFCVAAGSSTRTTPSLRLRRATPVSHQVRSSCQVKPASCKTHRIVYVLTSGSPSAACRNARFRSSSDHVAVPSLAGSGLRRHSRMMRSYSPGPYRRRRPDPGRSSSAAKAWALKRRTSLETESPTFQPACLAAAVKPAPLATASSATARRWRATDSLGAFAARVSSCRSASVRSRSGWTIKRAMVAPAVIKSQPGISLWQHIWQATH